MLDVPLSPASIERAGAPPHVVLLDAHGRPCGTAPKSAVHHTATPLHLAFSCYVVDAEGRVLLTRRAGAKATWPATWTNACCGHPQPGETLRQAVERHLRAELGMEADRMALALPDFTYRAVMDNGIVEHELCPVVVATASGDVTLAPEEADAAEWVPWRHLVTRAWHAPATLSPWSVRQIDALDAAIGEPGAWLASSARSSTVRRPAARVTAGRCASPTTEVIDPLNPFGPAFDELIDEVLAVRSARLEQLAPSSVALATVLGDLLRASAKRLRPAFVHWGHRAGGGEVGHPPALRLALAMELLHTFALVHDDVMDHSSTRRGAPSAHVTFAASAGTAPGAAWFGNSAAIVAGDLAFVWADELLDEACAGSPHGAAVRAAFHTMRTEVIAGQYLDLHHAVGGPAAVTTPSDAVRVALLKSGRYTVSRPLELGARLAGADEATVGALVAFGDAAGVAFQLRDDVLGVFGDELFTGKGATDDLREGKRTLLVLRAIELAPACGRRELLAMLGDPTMSDAAVARCRDIIATSGALASVEARINAEAMAAASALGPIDGPAGDALHELLTLLTERCG